MYFPFAKFQKEPLFAIFKEKLEIGDAIQEPLEPMLLSLGIQMMESKPESDYLLEHEKLFQVTVEPQLELLLEEEEMINLS